MRNLISISRLTCILVVDRRNSKNVLKFYRKIILITVTMPTALWKDIRKDCSSHRTTADEVVGLLKRRKLLSSFLAKMPISREAVI